MSDVRFGMLTELREVLEDRSSRRVLIVSGPRRRFVDTLESALAGFEVAVFDGAIVHVPEAIVQTASKQLRAFDPDSVVTIGGGSATGLGKALRLDQAFFFTAVPTTYSGSEMTNIYGITTDADKKTGRDERVRPDLVFYDAALTQKLPKALTVASLLNAIAQPVSALSTMSLSPSDRALALAATRRLFTSARGLCTAPEDLELRREALAATSLAGEVLDRGRLGSHHAIAHFLGGRFGVSHSALHSVLLPHTISDLRLSNPALSSELDRATASDLPEALFDLLGEAGADTSLKALGIGQPDLEAALRDRPELPAPLIEAAWAGRRPNPRSP